ncbi:MAG TPA: enoyl-CoA hydratase-related protein [Actinomycetota bacterium]|nr:enoyl-CoA hydratase-related protein [Actinomycetota bacterium]
MGEFVNLEVADGVGTIRLSRGKLNPINAQVVQEINEAIEAAETDDNVRAVVVWGGENVFAAGADINEMEDRDTISMFRYISGLQDVFTRLEHLPVVTIAAINGFALGGGCELALACDLRICAEDSQLGQPEILLGIIPGAGGTQRLPRLIGVGRAKDLIYSGRFVKADEALTMGLVNKVVSAADVYSTAVKWAQRYASGPTVALLAAKQVIQNGIDTDMATGQLLERQAFAALFSSEDQKIGMKSFIEEGPGKAKFVGR